MSEINRIIKQFLPDKLRKQFENRKKKKRPLYKVSKEQIETVMKGLANGTIESGVHGHALMRNLLKTMIDGRHGHIFIIPLIDGRVIVLVSDEDGPHGHGISDETATRTRASESIHKHVVRVLLDFTTAEGLVVKAGTVLLTNLDGLHEHGSDLLDSTNLDGSHRHGLVLGVLADETVVEIFSATVKEFWEQFGPFDLSEISPVVSNSDLFRRPCNFENIALVPVFKEMTQTEKYLIAAFGKDPKEVVIKQNDDEEVQELILSKRRFKTKDEALAEVRKRDYPNVTKAQILETPTAFRAQVVPTARFDSKSLRETTVEPGIKATVGVIKQSVAKQSEVQSLLFPKDKFTEAQARAFLKRNKFTASKLDEQGNFLRFRQKDPGAFSEFRTKTLPDSGGVKSVIGIKKKADDQLSVRKEASELVEGVDWDNLPIAKLTEEKQEVTGIVMEPDRLDLEEDIISAEDIEQAQRFHMLNSQVVGLHHKTVVDAQVVESYITLTPMTFTVRGKKIRIKKGTWLMTVRIHDPEIWRQVRDGELDAFSPGGFGQREPA